MSNDERPDSLAAQAAAWVPPWERQTRPPDRAYQAAAEEAARAEAEEAARSTAGPADADDLDADLTERAPDDERDPARPTGPDDPLAEIDEQTAVADLGEGEVGHIADPADESEMSEGAPELESEGPPAFRDKYEISDMGEVLEPESSLDFQDKSEISDEEPASGPGRSPALDDESGMSDEQAAPAFEAPPGPDGESEMSDDEGVLAPAATRPLDDESGMSDEEALEAPAVGNGSEMSADEVVGQSEPATEVAPGGGAGRRGKAGSAVPEQGRRRAGSTDAAGAAQGGDGRTDAGGGVEGDLPGLSDDGEFAAALEAILLVVDEPVGEMQLAQILEQPTERVAATLDDISARYTAAGHGFDLRRAAGGWRLYTRPEYAAYVERFVLDGQSVRLTQAALETLAVVAYKQPVTRSRISAIRGVNCDGVMRTLVTRGLIEECGTESETGAYLYRTTALFLEKLGLNSVDQLPPLAPFLPDDVEEVLDAPG